jgi:hypothetical protein
VRDGRLGLPHSFPFGKMRVLGGRELLWVGPLSPIPLLLVERVRSTCRGSLNLYALSVGALDSSSAEEFLVRASAGVLGAAKVHAEATRGRDPATRFVELLRSLFEACNAYAKDRQTGKHPRGWEELGWEKFEDSCGDDVYRPKRGADFVAWVDNTYIYLDREAAYAAVAAFAHRGGIPFGIRPRVLWGALKRAGISLTDSERTDTTARVEGNGKRVIQIPRAIICGEEES